MQPDRFSFLGVVSFSAPFNVNRDSRQQRGSKFLILLHDNNNNIVYRANLSEFSFQAVKGVIPASSKLETGISKLVAAWKLKSVTHALLTGIFPNVLTAPVLSTSKLAKKTTLVDSSTDDEQQHVMQQGKRKCSTLSASPVVLATPTKKASDSPTIQRARKRSVSPVLPRSSAAAEPSNSELFVQFQEMSKKLESQANLISLQSSLLSQLKKENVKLGEDIKNSEKPPRVPVTLSDSPRLYPTRSVAVQHSNDMPNYQLSAEQRNPMYRDNSMPSDNNAGCFPMSATTHVHSNSDGGYPQSSLRNAGFNSHVSTVVRMQAAENMRSIQSQFQFQLLQSNLSANSRQTEELLNAYAQEQQEQEARWQQEARRRK